jgi:hypothetical protein
MYHKLAPLLIAITGANGEYPKRVVASGGQYIEKDGRDIADQFFLNIDYPTEHTIVLASVMTNDVGLDTIIHGQHGTMEFGGGTAKEIPGSDIRIREQGSWAAEFRKANADMVEERKPSRTTRARIATEPAAGNAAFHDQVRAPARPHGRLHRCGPQGRPPGRAISTWGAPPWSRSRWVSSRTAATRS